MSRRSSGPHLWRRADIYDKSGKLTHHATWIIIDGTRQRGTGCALEDIAGAERALAEYIGKKHVREIQSAKHPPNEIPIAAVLDKYLADVVEARFEERAPNKREIYVAQKAGKPIPETLFIQVGGHARPKETGGRIAFLLEWWGSKTLDQVTGENCRAYVKKRGIQYGSRRELEDLRAAVNHYIEEGLCDANIKVWLPEKSPPRERWLTRHEAAMLIWRAWSYREMQNWRATDRRTRKHVAKFMLIARYMGSRAGVICSASIEKVRPKTGAWIDLANGLFYGRGQYERQTKKRKQMVRVPPKLLAHLRRWARNGQQYAVEWNGKPILRVTKAHDSVVKDVGLSDVTPHIWRHTAVTWAVQKPNPDLWKIAGYFGMTVEMLEKVYGHHNPAAFAGLHNSL
jgi:integrase